MFQPLTFHRPEITLTRTNSHHASFQAQYSGGVRKSASGVLESPPAQNYLSGSVQKEFRGKSLVDWTVTDVCDWLDSLFMPEYKVRQPGPISSHLSGRCYL